ncbi:hypothetical protein [Akkermansia sp.]|nr:hypothetical protein [uncultured Akkermansia sp.]MEE0764855.1 hypothetical protein [Akkermansia sp.]
MMDFSKNKIKKNMKIIEGTFVPAEDIIEGTKGYSGMSGHSSYPTVY